MVHEGELILMMVAEVGHMLDDESACPSGVTANDIKGFLGTVIEEYDASYDVTNSSIDDMKAEINEYFDHCTSEKDRLIAEEAAEAAVEIVEGAAMVASAACSWIPGANFALSAAVIAAEAALLALQIEVEKLRNTLVEDISNADGNLRVKPAFNGVKKYVDAKTSNTLFFPRLQFGMSILEMRAVFLASVITKKKELNKSHITSDDLKGLYVDWYHATQSNQTLITRFSAIHDLLKEHPADYPSFDKEASELIDSLAPAYKEVGVLMILNQTISLTISGEISGEIQYGRYQNVNDWVRRLKPKFINLGAKGLIADSEMDADELEMLTFASNCTKAITVLTGIAVMVFGSLKAVEAKDTNDKLTEAIHDSKTAITSYYEKLIPEKH